MTRLAAAVLCLATPISVAQPPTTAPAPPRSQVPAAASSLALEIAGILSDPAVARDHWGIFVSTMDGQPIYALNAAQLFQPASNVKLFTTAAALALLGPDRTFETRVLGKLNPATHTVEGDLVILGGGDANLSGRDLPYVAPSPHAPPAAKPDPLRYLNDLADQVAARGITHVTGDIVGDDTIFPWEPYPSDWAIDDAVWGYGAPVSALSIADNQLRLTITPGTITGPRGRETHYAPTVQLEQNGVPYYSVDSNVSTAPAKSRTGIQVERSIASRVLHVYGSMAEGADPDVEQIAIEDPAEYAAAAFIAMLESRGIVVDGRPRAHHAQPFRGAGFLAALHDPDTREQLTVAGAEVGGSCFVPRLPGTVLASHQSQPLAQDLVLTNKVSQNLHAELLLHHLGRRVFCGDGSTVSGARVVRAFLLNAGIDPNDFVFYDGSGLSTKDLVTPRATARLLAFAATQPWFAVWKSSLPIGGEDGSLTGRFAKPPLKDHIFAKTGTLSEARALSGYIETASGRTLIFSILVGNHLPGTSADRDAMDKIVAAIQTTQ